MGKISQKKFSNDCNYSMNSGSARRIQCQKAFSILTMCSIDYSHWIPLIEKCFLKDLAKKQQSTQESASKLNEKDKIDYELAEKFIQQLLPEFCTIFKV